MPELNYNLSTGINQNNLLNVRLDTQERLRDLNSLNLPAYQPPPAFIPKHFDTDELVKGSAELPTLREALYSKDPAIADAAFEQARYIASKDPTSTGLGMQNKVKYQEGQDKFTDNHWWKENNQTMYGFNPYQSVAENEDFLHKQLWDNYSIGGKLWRGVGTFAGRTLSKLVTGLVGAVGDIGAMAWNGLQEIGDLMDINNGTKNNFWEDVSNNWLSRKMQQADDYTKNSILPTYKALDYDGKGAWSKLLDPYTWQNSFADGAGFLLQFAIPGAAFGKAAQAGKLARGIGEFSTLEELAVVAPKAADAIKKAGMTIEQAKNVSGFTKLMGAEISDATKFGRVAGGATEFLTGSRNVGGITAHVFNTTLESVAETKEGFDHTVRELMEKGMSREDAVKIASENAPAQFWINMGILTASNAFENKLLQKAVGNRDANLFKKLGDDTLLAERKAATKVGKFFNENTWGKRFKFYGANSAKASFFEGYWEENAQTAAQRWARGEYERQGDDTGKGSKKEVTEAGLSGFFKQLYKQTIDSAKGNDREAADSIMAGVVIGVIGMGAFAKISGERKEIEKNKAETIARYTNTRDAWLSLSTLSPDIYEKDGSINKTKAQEKAKEIQEKLDKMGSVFQRAVTAETLTNPQEREKLQHKVFGDYVKAHILNGTEKALVQRLRDWGGKSQSELDMYGVSEEVKQDASKWSALAQTLVDKWNNEIKDIKYAAPKTETVESYFAKTAAVKSLIFDYTSLKEMSTGLAQKYSDLKDEVNPFSKFPDQQVYNEKHAELLALKTDLAENKVPVERDLIQSRIDDLEKEQAQRKKDLDTVGQTKADASGFLFPKGVDPKDNPIAIKDVNDFNHYQYQQTTHENAVKVHEQLIKDYSDPATGIQKYNDVVDFWSKAAEETAKKEEDEKAADEAKDTLESLVAQKQTLTEDLANAKTKEDRDKIEAVIKDIDAKIGDLTEVFGDTQDTGTSDTDSSDVDTPPPAGDQLGFQEFISELLAYVTPFKTVNKESRDERDDQNNIIPWKEYVLEDSYDHDLSVFVEDIALYPDKYDAFIIKDTEELLKQRLSAKRKEEFDIARATLGAIIVFREKGKKEWAKFEDRKDKPIIAFSYNEKAFETSKQERAKIKADKTGMSVQEALDVYAKQQKIADNLRAMIINDEIKEVPVKAVMGSLGLHPCTTYAENALKRFQGFYDVNDPIEIVQDVNVYPENFELGEILLKIPKDKTDSGIEDKTDSGIEHYIPVRAGYLTTSNETLNVKIMNAVQSIQDAKFDDKKDAELIVQNFLKGLFYVNENQYFKVLKDGAKFKIVHFVKDKNGKEVASKTFTGLKLKLSKVLYNGTNKLSVYEKDSVTNKYVPTELSQKDYKSFIHNVLETKRKVMIIKRGKTEKIYTKKVNGYLNLEQITQEDVDNGIAEEATPMNPLDAVFGTALTHLIPKTNIEDKKIDIERRRQEEFDNVASQRVIKVEDYESTNDEGETTYIQVRHYANGSRKIFFNIEKNKYGNTNDNSPNSIAKEQSTEDALKYNFDESTFGKPKKVGERTAKEASLDSHDRKINAKYDAELAVLKASEMPDVEEKKADIERRRREELKRPYDNKNKELADANEIASYGETYSEALDNLIKKQSELNDVLNKRQKEDTKDRSIHQYTKEELEAQPEYQENKRLDGLINQINSVYGEAYGFDAKTSKGVEEIQQDIKDLPQKRKTADAKINAKYDAELAELENPTPSKAAEQPTVDNTLTQEAKDLLKSIGEGSKPTFITKNLERIAKENGIEVTDKMSADDVINALKEKQKQPSEQVGSVVDVKDGFKQAGEKARGTKDATHIGRWMLDNSQKGDVVRFGDGGYEVTEVNTRKDGTKEIVLTPFEFNEDGTKDYNNTGIKIITEQSIKNGSNLFENAYTNSKGERVVEQSTYERGEQTKKADIERRRQEEIDNVEKVQSNLKDDLNVTSKIVKDVYLNGLHYLQTEDGKFYVIPDSNSAGYGGVSAVEASKEEILKPFRTRKEWDELREKKSDQTPLDLEQMIREAELELEGIKKTIQEKIDGTELDEQKEFFKEKGDMLIEIKQGKIDEMKALLPKGEDKVQSPLEELRTEVEFDQPMANIPQTTNIKVNKKEYQIDFDNNKFISASAKTPTDIEKLIEYFENAHSYTIKNVNINGKSVYLVKYNKLGKFVILDENFNTTPETKEMLDNEEYKKFKNCE